MNRHLLSITPTARHASRVWACGDFRKKVHRFRPSEKCELSRAPPSGHLNRTSWLKQSLLLVGLYRIIQHSPAALWQLNMPLINKVVRCINVQMNIGFMEKTIKRSLIIERLRLSLFLISSGAPERRRNPIVWQDHKLMGKPLLF